MYHLYGALQKCSPKVLDFRSHRNAVLKYLVHHGNAVLKSPVHHRNAVLKSKVSHRNAVLKSKVSHKNAVLKSPVSHRNAVVKLKLSPEGQSFIQGSPVQYAVNFLAAHAVTHKAQKIKPVLFLSQSKATQYQAHW